MDENWAKDFMPEYEYKPALTKEQNIQLMILIRANENYKAKYPNGVDKKKTDPQDAACGTS